jgi:biopolymer transport protein ExbD
MKYPRNTRIFRGQLDVAPVACLFFVTAILLFLHSQIVFTPGVRLDLHPGTDIKKPSLYIDSDGLFHYQGTRMSPSAFEKRIRADAEKNTLPTALTLQIDPRVTTNSVNKVRELAAELSFAIEPPGTRIELPELPDQPGARSPSVIVAVNLNGQFFFENQLVSKIDDLRKRLTRAAREAREPMTLVLRLDKAVAVDTVVQLSEMAREAGFSDVILATRPALKPVEINTQK